jgi:hypothetical protein
MIAEVEKAEAEEPAGGRDEATMPGAMPEVELSSGEVSHTVDVTPSDPNVPSVRPSGGRDETTMPGAMPEVELSCGEVSHTVDVTPSDLDVPSVRSSEHTEGPTQHSDTQTQNPEGRQDDSVSFLLLRLSDKTSLQAASAFPSVECGQPLLEYRGPPFVDSKNASEGF